MKETKRYMGIDQHGWCYHDLKHPRKDLMERLGIKHAAKMYVDGKDGKSYHIGYVIGNNWITLYEVKPLRRQA